MRAPAVYTYFGRRLQSTVFGVLALCGLQAQAAEQNPPPDAKAAPAVPRAPAPNSPTADLFEKLTKDFLHELIEISKVSKEKKGDKSAEGDVLMQQASEKIDFTALARKSLGARWPKLPQSERNDFLVTLQKILEQVAYPKAQKLAVSEDAFKFDYLEQSVEPRVKVTGEMEREKRGEMVLEKIDIEIIFDKKTKKIVDAVLEGEKVSQNLKRQFDESFKKKTFAQIIEQMKKRLARVQEDNKA